ncbi:hypothetical protein EON63_00060 [archaeon]|nr:MAG: hypothetical protein EON63_00060 [archaeon]
MSSSAKNHREHLQHLLNTRGLISDELSYYSNTLPVPSGVGGMRSVTSHSIKPPKKLRKLDRDKQINKHCGLLTDILAPPPQNIMVSYPFTSATATGQKPAAPTVIKLPIFRLPPANPLLISANTNAHTNRTHSPHANSHTHTSHTRTSGSGGSSGVSSSSHIISAPFIPYDSLASMYEAMYTMIQALHPKEHHILIQSLHLQHYDITDALENFKHLVAGQGGQGVGTDQLVGRMDASMMPRSLLGYFLSSMDSIFLTAKFVIINNKHAQQQMADNAHSLQSFSTMEVLQDLDKDIDLIKIGFSPGLKSFLLSEKIQAVREASKGGSILNQVTSQSVVYQASSSMNNKKKKQIRLKPLTQSAHSLSAPSLHLPSILLAPSLTSSQPFAIQSANANLTQELIESLTSVQKHSLSLKKTLEAAQSLISLQDTKARHLVNMIAVEKLVKALGVLVITDKRRGMIAWKLYVHQYDACMRHTRLVHSMVLRNTLIGLRRRLHKVLSRRVKMWRQYTMSEVQRLRRKRILDSTVKIQSQIRRCLATKRVTLLRQRRKYEKLYDSTIKIQAVLRGKRLRWKYQKRIREIKEREAALRIQRNYRGYVGRKRAAWIRFKKNRHGAAANMQKIIRGYLARKRVRKMRRDKREKRAATSVQAIVRGFLARKNIATIIVNRARYMYARRIQALVRGALTRMNRATKIKEIQEYKSERRKAVTKIQSAYRGYRSRILYRLMMFQWKQHRDRLHRASTHITRIVRAFLAKRYLQELKRERREHWIQMARQWQELWSEESETWYYYNISTQETAWEPSKQGYVKFDGKLVLTSGEIIDDPNSADGTGEGGGTARGEGEAEEKSRAKKINGTKLLVCTECNERVAIVTCEECGDIFCTKCYKFLHALGARRSHHHTPLGPKDCNECEICLAERYCVACDENFCDPCWRVLHAHGKRCFHPYSEISTDGRVDSRVYTMDGDQLQGTYDMAAYTQTKVDTSHNNQIALSIADQLSANSQLLEMPNTYTNSSEHYDEYGSEGGSLVVGEEGGYYDESSIGSVQQGRIVYL